MFKKSVYLGLLTVCCLGNPVFATSHPSNLEESFTLEAGVSLRLANPLANQVTVYCTVQTISTTAMQINAVNGTGQVNGTSLRKGQSLTLTLVNAQVIPVTASTGAEAVISNLGSYPIKVSCS